MGTQLALLAAVNLQTNVLPVRFLSVIIVVGLLRRFLNQSGYHAKTCGMAVERHLLTARSSTMIRVASMHPALAQYKVATTSTLLRKLDSHLRCRHVGEVIRFYYGGAFPLPLTADQNFEVLQEIDDGAIFILHHLEETFGNVVTIICLGPPSSAGEYFYELSTNEYFYDLSKNSQGKEFQVSVLYAEYSEQG
ncbi:E3 UBIQUITIN-PROTEIN LIGASE SINA-LIKE 4 [Salix purpurea]|uniref:E3 UBIQUITIN-PROTEIN LIGASE SINA-LIKE 4 n=1 Tax=Salix purpurea TaxID=77065 RepID=A0A9Q0ZHY9_SALPP|nr:E3 UBIQUITIN-PROTEIN LIGASE SINA-LIKE 4 [Salix purpurea]